PGVPGQFMSYLPIMVMIVLSVALLTAMVFLPVVGGVLSNARIAGLFAGAAAAGAAVVLLDALGPAKFAAAGVAFLFAAIITTKLAGRWGTRAAPKATRTTDSVFHVEAVRGPVGLYVRTLKVLAGNILGIVFTLALVLGIAYAILSNFMANNNGVEFFVDEEPDVAVIMVSARGNMSAKEALNLVADVEREVLAIDGVENVVTTAFPSGTNTGGGGVADAGEAPADIIGQLQVELVPYCCRRPALGIFEEIRARTNFAGIKTEVREIQGGPPTGKDIQLQLTSNDYDQLVAATGQVRDHIETVEGLRDVEDDRPLPGIEWQLEVDREEAGRFGANIATIGQVIQLVTNGVLLSEYQPNDSEDQVEIRVRFPVEDRTLDQFANLRLQTDKGLIPIVNFINVTPEPRVSTIGRIDGQYVMTVKADVVEQDGYDLNAKIAEIDTWVKAQDWPSGMFFTFRGANEEQAESFSFLMKAMVASLVLMFLVLVTQFNNFYQTALTLMTIILSVFGVLLGMLITGQKFSVIMTGTGVIALAGIVVNNAIVLIDTFNRQIKIQPDRLTAILATAEQRIRPILLTTITTIAGLIPMATQVNLDFFTRTIAVGGITSVWWVQLSTAIISGLAFSTILTLLVVPVMLAMPETVRRKVRRLRSREDEAPTPPMTGDIVPALAGVSFSAAPVEFTPAAPSPAVPGPQAVPAQQPSPVAPAAATAAPPMAATPAAASADVVVRFEPSAPVPVAPAWREATPVAVWGTDSADPPAQTLRSGIEARLSGDSVYPAVLTPLEPDAPEVAVPAVARGAAAEGGPRQSAITASERSTQVGDVYAPVLARVRKRADQDESAPDAPEDPPHPITEAAE
ncbi:MAG: efflux RND transporter permease subunit, partial [Pseudomonadota bacterium]